jgi:hypothetical protein
MNHSAQKIMTIGPRHKKCPIRQQIASLSHHVTIVGLPYLNYTGRSWSWSRSIVVSSTLIILISFLHSCLSCFLLKSIVTTREFSQPTSPKTIHCQTPSDGCSRDQQRLKEWATPRTRLSSFRRCSVNIEVTVNG